MADKVLTMSGADDTATPVPTATPAGAQATTDLSTVVSGWTWKHILALVGGSFAAAGGGAMAFYGWSREKKVWKWGGVALLGVGVISIGVTIYLAYVRSKAIAAGLLGGYGTTPADAFVDPNRVAARGDMVALSDGRRARVNQLTTSLDGSRSYGVRVVEDGRVAGDDLWVRGEQLAGVIVAR